MAYTKHTWEKGQIISADDLNNIELGLETVDSNLNAIIGTSSDGSVAKSLTAAGINATGNITTTGTISITDNNTTKVSLDTSGNATFSGNLTVGTGTTNTLHGTTTIDDLTASITSLTSLPLITSTSNLIVTDGKLGVITNPTFTGGVTINEGLTVSTGDLTVSTGSTNLKQLTATACELTSLDMHKTINGQSINTLSISNGSLILGYATGTKQFNGTSQFNTEYNYLYGYTMIDKLSSYIQNTVSGRRACALGYQTSAVEDNQFVFGIYNAVPEEGAYVELVGNGTSNTNRSNARTLDLDGNEWLAGQLTVNKDLKVSGTFIRNSYWDPVAAIYDANETYTTDTIVYDLSTQQYKKKTSSDWTIIDNPYLEIIGNGTSNELSNARILDHDGNEWLAGILNAATGLNIGEASTDNGTTTYSGTTLFNTTSNIIHGTTEIDKLIINKYTMDMIIDTSNATYKTRFLVGSQRFDISVLTKASGASDFTTNGVLFAYDYASSTLLIGTSSMSSPYFGHLTAVNLLANTIKLKGGTVTMEGTFNLSDGTHTISLTASELETIKTACGITNGGD